MQYLLIRQISGLFSSLSPSTVKPEDFLLDFKFEGDESEPSSVDQKPAVKEQFAKDKADVYESDREKAYWQQQEESSMRTWCMVTGVPIGELLKT